MSTNLNAAKQKRLIKYWSSYNDLKFSNCSTRYEVLPEILNSDASFEDIKFFAKIYGIELVPQCKHSEVNQYDRSLVITHSIRCKETKTPDKFNQRKTIYVNLGLITIPNREYLKETIDNKVSDEMSYDLINNQDCDLIDFATIGKEDLIVISGWDYFHFLPLLGYDLKSFEQGREIIFEDSVSRCSACGEWMYNDNGYQYNYRITNSELLGIDCGCFAEHCEKNLDDFFDDAENPIELEIAENLAKNNKIKFVERFIGGMTDGRGGYWHGKGEGCGTVREGNPEEILNDLKNENPEKSYVFSHDESGQFQTYFSVWEVL